MWCSSRTVTGPVYLLQLVTVEHLSAWLYYCMVVLHVLCMYRLLKCKCIAVCVCVHAGVYVCAGTIGVCARIKTPIYVQYVFTVYHSSGSCVRCSACTYLMFTMTHHSTSVTVQCGWCANVEGTQ